MASHLRQPALHQPRTSSIHPRASIASVRACTRSYNAFLLGVSPIFIARHPSNRFLPLGDLGERLSRQQAYFHRAYQFLLIRRRNLFRRGRIQPPQHSVQMSWRVLRRARPQFLATLPSAAAPPPSPSSKARKYNPVPTVKIGKLSAARKLLQHFNRALPISPAVASSMHPAHPSSDAERRHALPTAGFAVPMSNPRYSCVESHAITSPPNCSASQTPNADFPDAVGPTMATSGESWLRFIWGTATATPGSAAPPAQSAPAAGCRAPVAGEFHL